MKINLPTRSPRNKALNDALLKNKGAGRHTDKKKDFNRAREKQTDTVDHLAETI